MSERELLSLSIQENHHGKYLVIQQEVVNSANNALTDVSLTIKKVTFTVLSGKMGGKVTLIKIIISSY